MARTRDSLGRSYILAVFLSLTACTGAVRPNDDLAGGSGGADSQGGNAGDVSEGGQSGGKGSTTSTAAVSPQALTFRRLNRFEYDNTIRDLLGDTNHPSGAFPADSSGPAGFLAAIGTSDLEINTISETAATVAARAVSKLNTVLPCASSATTSTAQESCARSFIDNFGRRAFRRPLEAQEAQNLLLLYQTARGDLALDFSNAIRVVLTGMLQAPPFLYHWEGGSKVGAGDIATLGPYERASRLSYFLWGSTPDETLLDAASKGELADDSGLRVQVRRLLQDARSREAIGEFFVQLLDLRPVLSITKDAKLYPMWDQPLRDAMLAETLRFIGEVTIGGDGMWNTLLTAKYSYLNTKLGEIYGQNGLSGTDLKQINLNDAQRAGLLTQPSFLASKAAPADGAFATAIKRGRFVRERLLCQTVPDPPAGIKPKPVDPGGTTRERLTQHASDPNCSACHALLDPPGFAFENFDVIGRWRSSDNGKPVNAAGTLTDIDGKDQAFSGAVDLIGILAKSPEANDCIVRQLLRYATVQEPAYEDAGVLRNQLPKGDLNLRNVMESIVMSPRFLQRVLDAGEPRL